MDLKELILKTRSCRRFDDHQIRLETLENLVDLARLSASGGNRQPLKYLLYKNRKNVKGFFLIWPGQVILRNGKVPIKVKDLPHI